MEEVEEIAKNIKAEFPRLLNEDCNPIPAALDLLLSNNQSSVESFMHSYEMVEYAMDIMVENYHQGFHESIESFSSVLERLYGSKRKLDSILEHLTESSESLLGQQYQDLFQVWVKTVQYKESIRILDLLNEIRLIPDKIEEAISSKSFPLAIEMILASSIKLRNAELSGIGALSEIQRVIEYRRNTIHTVIGEELVDVLNSRTESHLLYSSHKGNMADLKQNFGRDYGSNRSLYSGPNSNNSSSAPDSSEAFLVNRIVANGSLFEKRKYIKDLIQCVTDIAKLPVVVEDIKSRMNQEFSVMIERIISRVEEVEWHRLGTEGKSQIARDGRDVYWSYGFDKLVELNTDHVEIFISLMDQLFDIFEKTLDLYGAFIDAVQDSKHSVNISLEEVWILIQAELKSLIEQYTHLNATKKKSVFQDIDLMEDIMQGKKSAIRVPKSDLLTFENMSFEEDNFNNSLKLNYDTAHDDSIVGRKSKAQKLIFTPNINLVVPIFTPIKIWSDKVNLKFFNSSSPLPKESSVASFVEKILCNDYLTFIEGVVIQRYQEFMKEGDSFLIENSYNFAISSENRPVFKSTMALLHLVYSICLTLGEIPNLEGNIVKLVNNLLESYQVKCSAFFQTLASNDIDVEKIKPSGKDQSFIIFGANLANEAKLMDLLMKDSNICSKDAMDSKSLSSQEHDLIFNIKKERPIHKSEIIFDESKLQFLANLHFSLDWLLYYVNRILSIPRMTGSKPKQSVGDINGKIMAIFMEQHRNLQLTVSGDEEMVKGTLRKAERLNGLCLFTLRMEVKTRAIYFIESIVKENSFKLDEIPIDPDAGILILNNELTLIRNIAFCTLPSEKQRFLFAGLDSLITSVIFRYLHHIKEMNDNGQQKMLINLLSISQTLISLDCPFEDPSLSFVRKFFGLFEAINTHSKVTGANKLPPNFQVEYAAKYKMTDVKKILDLLYGEVTLKPDSNKYREYNTILQQIKSEYDELVNMANKPGRTK